MQLRRREFAMLKSIGMTKKQFHRMIGYESIFYGFKTCLYGLPIAFLIMVILSKTFSLSFENKLYIPWLSLIHIFAAIAEKDMDEGIYRLRQLLHENAI